MEQDARLSRLEDALARLAEAQARTEEQFARQGAQIQALTEAQRRTEEQLARLGLQVEELVSWQRGEAGRREGERYEQDVVQRASVLFNGGHGGAPNDPGVRHGLTGQLQTLLAEDIWAAEADPFLADLLWWKRDRLAVVEVSVQVNGEDVRRAVQRAETLRRGGAQAVAVVIGENWATLDTRERAHTSGVAWKVGADLSEGFLALRRLVPENGDGSG